MSARSGSRTPARRLLCLTCDVEVTAVNYLEHEECPRLTVHPAEVWG